MSAPRLSRRQVVAGATAAGMGIGLGTRGWLPRADGADPVIVGTGNHRYEWVPGWGRLPDGKEYGNTHGGIVVDASERVYVNTDTAQAVLMFDASGAFIGSWGKDFAGGLHGMTLVRQCDEEFLFATHTARHEAVKATLDGQVLTTFPFPSRAGVYTSPTEYNPTGVAVAPNGSVYVADGYGKSWVHQYSASGDYVRSWGGLGTDPGKFRTPHGIWVDTRRATPVVVVADRENARLQTFDLDGKLLEVTSGMFRRPCGVHQLGDDLVIPDLAGRVTILDKANKLVTHLGDNPNTTQRANNGIDRPLWKDGVFIAPHAARWDDDGNLYVMDWNYRGRVSKLRRLD